MKYEEGENQKLKNEVKERQNKHQKGKSQKGCDQMEIEIGRSN